MSTDPLSFLQPEPELQAQKAPSRDPAITLSDAWEAFTSARHALDACEFPPGDPARVELEARVGRAVTRFCEIWESLPEGERTPTFRGTPAADPADQAEAARRRAARAARAASAAAGIR